MSAGQITAVITISEQSYGLGTFGVLTRAANRNHESRGSGGSAPGVNDEGEVARAFREHMSLLSEWSVFSGSVGSSARSVSHTERLATVVAPTLHRRTPDLVQRPITMRRRVVTWGSGISEELSRHVIMQGGLASFSSYAVLKARLALNGFVPISGNTYPS
jgi:hypothetical protein